MTSLACVLCCLHALQTSHQNASANNNNAHNKTDNYQVIHLPICEL